jgi:hypothetical protein
MPRPFRNARVTRSRLGILPIGQFDSFGASIWEWLHPDQVRAEYEMQMRTVPDPVTFADVVAAGVEDARDVASEAADDLGAGISSVAEGTQKVLIAGAAAAIIAGMVYLSNKRGRR